jgi:pimeloyl-ACP methyl ester carboxylesterase
MTSPTQTQPTAQATTGGTPGAAAVPTVLPRQRIHLRHGDVAYVDQGDGNSGDVPVALFVHGVLVNADLWRNVIWDVADVRRCIAPDLPAHGASPAPLAVGAAAQDLSLNGLAAMLDELCERLGVDRVDVVANDTGGAVSQVFAARFPHRIRTLTLTNCDVHENFPPEAFRPFVALAETGEFGPMVAAMAADLAVARSEMGFAMGYADPSQLSDALLTSYLGPFAADGGKGLERFLTASSAEELMAVEPLLGALTAPAQVAWGTADRFFEPAWAERLATMIPSVERVTLVSDAMLFWPDERAADLVPLLREFWEAHP